MPWAANSLVKNIKKTHWLYFCLGFCIVALGQGCEKAPGSGNVHAIGGGFGISSKWIGIDTGPGAALVYQGTQSRPVLIWPFLGLSEDPILTTNDMVFFPADIPDAQGRFGDELYMAAQAPGPAVDISDDLLKLWAASNHLDFAAIKPHYSPGREEPAGDGIRITFLSTPPLADFVVSWQDISNMIQNAKRAGKPHIIEKPHVVYLKSD
jgi:hypothetical protein